MPPPLFRCSHVNPAALATRLLSGATAPSGWRIAPEYLPSVTVNRKRISSLPTGIARMPTQRPAYGKRASRAALLLADDASAPDGTLVRAICAPETDAIAVTNTDARMMLHV